MSEAVRLNDNQRKLIEDRVGLAKAIGHRAWKRLVGYERDEIIAYAIHGLVAAAVRWEAYCEENNFEPYLGDAQSWFDTYASRRINGSIIDALRASDPATRRERALIKEIIAAGVDLSSPWEHESAERIAARAGMQVADVKRALSALVRMPVPLEDTTEDAWPSDPVDVAEEAMTSTVCHKVAAAIKKLPENHQLIIAMAYYLDLSDEEITDRMPELRSDPSIGRHALAWVIQIREQSAIQITEVLRRELQPEYLRMTG